MSSYDYDLFTIGAGSGGVRASRVSAGLGARVAVAEERYLGGTCVNVGCIPKKLFVYASEFSHAFEDAAGFGWTVGRSVFDWKTLLANKNAEIERLNGVHARMLDAAGVDHLEGRARLLDDHTVEIAGRRITAKHILIAVGGWPTLPDVPGIEHAITSNEAFFLDKIPQSVLIVGGGYIAVEFAGIFHGLGAHITQLYRGELFLRGFDDDARSHLAGEMKKNGIDLRFRTDVTRIGRAADGITATLGDGTTLDADVILYATGRHPLTEDLGLETVGVKLEANGAIPVDAYGRTNVESIWALGDVTDRIQLTPVALHEAMCLAQTLFNDNPTSPVHDAVPSAVFSQPPLATVGLTEAEARARYGEVEIYRSRFRPLKATLSGRDEQTLTKLVVDRESQRVVGAHMVGHDAGEILQGIAIAVKMGATKAQFDATVGIHPSSAEEFVTMREPVST